jgi:polyisoprenoid-binding protein YceI
MLQQHSEMQYPKNTEFEFYRPHTALIDPLVLYHQKTNNMIQTTNNWAFEPSHCKIAFSVRHFGITETEGFFRKFDGTIITPNADFSDAEIEFSVAVNSIDTQDEQRDGHLLSPDFFDAENFPILHFKSTSFVANTADMYVLKGELTMRGKTMPVTFDVEFGGIVEKDPFGFTKAGFSLEGKINRKDWGIVWNRSLDMGGIAVGEMVKIRCFIELVKTPTA